MELWIRSQDKKILSKIEMININYNYNNEIIANYKQLNRDDEDYTPLGRYDTPERALEVLDEIQNLLKPKIILRKGKITGCVDDTIFREPDGYDIKELSTYVYEMPKE